MACASIYASIDGVGAKQECKVREQEVIPALVPSSIVLDSRASTSTTSILFVSYFLALSSSSLKNLTSILQMPVDADGLTST